MTEHPAAAEHFDHCIDCHRAKYATPGMTAEEFAPYLPAHLRQEYWRKKLTEITAQDRAEGAVPDTGQAREPGAHPVGGFTHDPGLAALVADQIAETYSDDEYQIRPDPGDVIADVMETVRADIRDRAEDQARCGKTDECTAKALVLTRLADWLEGWPSGDTVQTAAPAALAYARSEVDKWLADNDPYCILPTRTEHIPALLARLDELEGTS